MELHVEVEGLAGREYSLDIANPKLALEVKGATLDGSELKFKFSGTTGDGFARHDIIIGVK